VLYVLLRQPSCVCVYTQGSQRLGDHLAQSRQRQVEHTLHTDGREYPCGQRTSSRYNRCTAPFTRSLPSSDARSDLVLIWLTSNPQQVSRCSLCSLLSRAFRLRFGGPDSTVGPRDTPFLDSLPFHRATSGIPLRGSFAFQTYPDAGPRLAWKESGIQHQHSRAHGCDPHIAVPVRVASIDWVGVQLVHGM
jgi:hypothetical protein